MRKVITVDGLAASGKTTLSKRLAEMLGFAHLSSGLLYRAVGYLALREGVALDDEQGLARLVKSHSIALKLSPSKSSLVAIDGLDVTGQLSSPDVSEAASTVGQHGSVRTELFEAQRRAFEPEPLVAEGRDMGTVVFADAPLKFFIVADERVRLERRFAQFGGTSAASAEEAKKEILERDRRDSERQLAPTVAAQDAVVIDNSAQTLTQVLKTMYDTAAQRGLV